MDLPEDGIHLHCLNCIKILKCTASSQGCFSCPIIYCDLDCGAIFHACKKKEHQLLCFNEKVPCYNAEYGCPCLMQRKYLARHLKSCPASVVHCAMEWNRQYINPKGEKILQKCLESLKQQPQLDIALALRDLHSLPMLCTTHAQLPDADRIGEACSRVIPSNCIINFSPNACNKLYHQCQLLQVYNYLKATCKSMLYNFINEARTKNDAIEINENKENLQYFINNHEIDSNCAFLKIFKDAWIKYENCDTTNCEDESKMLSFSENIVSAITSYPTRYLGLGEYCVTMPHSCEPMLTFPCGQEFRRDEYTWHYKNVHSEIYAGLNGWLQERCPLAQYGCTFSRQRLSPLPKGSAVVYNKITQNIGVTPASQDISESCQSFGARMGSVYSCDSNIDEKSTFQHINLLQLPFEVLQHIARFLDSFSLSNLALTSCLLRDVCQSLLVEHGIVTFRWERQKGSGVSWKVTNKRWFYSSHFSPIREWTFEDSNNMSNHLKTCVYFDRNKKIDPYYYPMGPQQNNDVYQMLKAGIVRMGFDTEKISTKL